MTLDLLVLADDRTGALETAGALADRGWKAVMWPYRAWRADDGDEGCAVVDLDTRHVDAATAATRVRAALGVGAVRQAHKIDSTLRGRWAAELVARHTATAARTLVVASFPAVGRTCVGGVVREHGVPVTEASAGRDPSAPARHDRPADALAAHGAPATAQLAGVEAVAAWLGHGAEPFAVADAATDDDLDAIGRAWCDHPDVVLAGTAAAIASAGGAISGRRPETLVAPPIGATIMVVCGSLHPAARAQVAALGAAGWSVMADGDLPAVRRLVLTTAGVVGGDDTRAARAVAAELAQRARAHLAAHPASVVVLVGGETAAAFLGDRPMAVVGTMAPGVACSSPLADPAAPLVVTRPGGFGGPDALVDLLGPA
jgi:uncharacterized protein YgbK (DUF1537 family)